MGLKLTPEKAAIHGRVAVISDVHLGFENVLQMRGVAIPRLQIEEVISKVRRIISKYNLRKLIIAGDFKHEFSKNLPYEWEDVKAFLKAVEDVEISVVRGNHDNYLAAILADYGVELKEYEIIPGTDVRVVHGHREVEFEKVVMGHEHPAVRIRVRGGVYTFPCYLVADDTKLVLPAFSPLMTGSNVLQGDFLSPLLRKASKIEVFAVEEEVFYLGTVEQLKNALKSEI